jgi:predicted amidohydrolase YtcJ
MKAHELILYGGKITTLDVGHPQVSAVAIRGDRVWATGGAAGARHLPSSMPT